LKKSEPFSSLHVFFTEFQGSANAEKIRKQFLSIVHSPDGCCEPGLTSVYEEAVRLVEDEAAGREFDMDLVSLQRNLYAEIEDIRSHGDQDDRHHFLIVIPIADRPVMLKNCLGSLIEQCREFRYGGFTRASGGQRIYKKISLFIVDDSRDPENIRKIRDLCSAMMSEGIRTYYFGLSEQTEVLNQLPSGSHWQLRSILGYDGIPVQPHKGASISRNIAYLCLSAFLDEFSDKALIYFLDSDEEFRVKIKRGRLIEDITFINYFYWLDKLFSTGDIEIATGRVVGDPPVSPSVMISTFLEDITLFLGKLSGIAPDAGCVFHEDEPGRTSSAEYHDMANLFGYERLLNPRRYHCSLSGAHTVRECFEDFSKKTLGFFNGLHPTRTQFYVHADFIETNPARTVYTGNYLFKPGGLMHFIPFANLKLRMAGPSLGRILRERLGQKFVSVNLPLLHRRTSSEDYGNEFRSGVTSGNNSIDVSLEFNRQFWGDVMLFTIEKISEAGYPVSRIGNSEISAAAQEILDKLWSIYKERQNSIATSTAGLRDFLYSDGHWWHTDPGSQRAVENMELFCCMIEKNFGENSKGIKKIARQIEEGTVLSELIDAISAFYEVDAAWNKLLESPLTLPQCCKPVFNIPN
jgi:hypothetical protein